SAPKVRKTAASPYMHVGFVRQPHGLTGCHAERFIELRDIDKRAIHAPLRWRVDIAEQAAAQEVFAAFVEPAERVAEKEALERWQARGLLAFLVLLGFLERLAAARRLSVLRDLFTG